MITTDDEGSFPVTVLGELREGSARGAPLATLETHVRAEISGSLVRVRLVQRFVNDRAHAIEVVYLFPLAHAGAVSSIELVAGGKRIRSVVRERVEARAVYEGARRAGKHAALLEQERPDLFTLSVSGVQPGEAIEVEITLDEHLVYDDGRWRWTVPVVPPHRFGADASLARARGPHGEPRVRPLGIQVVGRMRQPLAWVRCASHATRTTRQDLANGWFVMELADSEQMTAKDFVLEVRPASPSVTPALFVHRGRDDRRSTFLLTLSPGTSNDPGRAVGREIVLVIDRSGSMSGAPFLQAQRAIKAALRTLGERDLFRIMPFSSGVDEMLPGAAPWSQDTLDLADLYVDNLTANGGTNIQSAMVRALDRPKVAGCARTVVFLTDGGVSNEREVLSTIEALVGDARIYAFGVGASVNRALIEGMATAGRGVADFLGEGEDIEMAMSRLAARLSLPVLTDVRLEWDPPTAVDVLPAKLPDLFAGQPLEVVGRFDGEVPKSALLRGHVAGAVLEQRIPLGLGGAGIDDEALPRLWAVRRVDQLLTAARRSPERFADIRREIVELAVAHSVATPYTSHVAVEDEASTRRTFETEADPSVLLPAALGSWPMPEPARLTTLTLADHADARAPDEQIAYALAELRVARARAQEAALRAAETAEEEALHAAQRAEERRLSLEREEELVAKMVTDGWLTPGAAVPVRIEEILRLALNDMIAKAEDPVLLLGAVALHGQIVLVEGKKLVAAAIADEKRLAKQREAEAANALEWERRAIVALEAGEDELAREAIARKKEHGALALQLGDEWTAQRASVEHQKDGLRALNDKIEEAKRKRAVLTARFKRAEAQKNINEVMHGLSNASAFERMEKKVDAQAEAASELSEEYSGSTLASKFEALAAASGADDELVALKRKMGLAAGAAAPATTATAPSASPGSVSTTPRQDSDGPIADELRALARTQRASGAWGADKDDLRRTCAAVVLLARGHQTHRSGLYQRQIARALRWLADQLGVLASAPSKASEELALIAWACAEVASVTRDEDDEARAREARTMLEHASADAGGAVGTWARGVRPSDEDVRRVAAGVTAASP